VAKSKSIETDAAKLYNSGLAIDDVAEELGVCYRTARKALRNSGVTLRDPSARLRGRTSPKRKKSKNE
jgi:orotate phosphoribosyltransferase-like protein